jgi:hypothetical protein
MQLLNDSARFRGAILRKLYDHSVASCLLPDPAWQDLVPSSVMLLLGRMPVENGGGHEKQGKWGDICVVLNKRSRRVKQAGDLCCPGGSVEPELDPMLAKLLLLPGSPLWTWPHWKRLKRECPQEARLLALLLATSLREAWEEMRLNPLSVRFLGFISPQRLRLYRRIIYPMVGWVYLQKRFVPSWEVESIVQVPVTSLLDPDRYARFRLYIPRDLRERYPQATEDYPCFIHRSGESTELLWGATYWIVTRFVERIFGFKPPDPHSLPLVPGLLDEGYIFGRCACGRFVGNATYNRDGSDV